MNLMAIRKCQILLMDARIGRWDKLWLSCRKLIFLNIVNRMYGNTEVFLVQSSLYQSLQRSRDATNNNFLSFWLDPIWARTFGTIVVVTVWYLCNHCLSPLKLCIRTPFMTRCFRYNIMWKSLSVTCDRLEVFSGYYVFPTNKTDRHDIIGLLHKYSPIFMQ
jgi:hypothetical protein